MIANVQGMPTGILLQTYRETLMALGADRENTKLAQEADQLEAEIDRRCAW